MKNLFTVLGFILAISVMAQGKLKYEVDPFTKVNAAYVDKNYTLVAKMGTSIIIDRAERLQQDSGKVFSRLYMNVWLGKHFCFSDNSSVVLLTQNDEQITLPSKSFSCSNVKCSNGMCQHLLRFSPLLTASEFFAAKNKAIKMIRINTKEGYVNLDIDSERYQTNLARLVENFVEFETADTPPNK